MIQKNRSLAYILLPCIALLISACNKTPQPSQAGNVLFSDDFSNSKSGWDRTSEDNGSVGYVNGTYQFFVDDVNSDFFANPYQNFADTRVEVEALKLEGDDNNNFGIICRYKDVENFYAGLITSDGYVGIIKMDDGLYKVLGKELLFKHPAVNQGNAKNLLRFDCIGQELVLYVNGQPVEYQTDAEWLSGDVGLLAGSFDSAGVRIAFDNFVVYNP